MPALSLRAVPDAFMDALRTRFGAQCSTALAVRQQHGRDESAFEAPPPSAVVFAHSTQDVADAVALAARLCGARDPLWRGLLAGGAFCLAVQGGISIDVSRMNQVLSLTPKT